MGKSVDLPFFIPTDGIERLLDIFSIPNDNGSIKLGIAGGQNVKQLETSDVNLTKTDGNNYYVK